MSGFELFWGRSYVKDICKTLSFPAPTIKKTLDSTNTYLRSMAEDGAANGSVVIAQRQSAGRGRTGKSFLSPEGGLYMSMLLRCDFTQDQLNLITPTAAVATATAIKEVLGIEVSVKWVNDLFYEGKKVCGILAEAVRHASGGHIECVILGIGVNVFSPAGGFGELSEIAGSLLTGKKEKSLIYRLASVIIRNFFDLWQDGKDMFIYNEYRNRLFIIGEGIHVIKGEKKIPAKVIDLERDYSLTVEYSDGLSEKLKSGEISIIPHVNS